MRAIVRLLHAAAAWLFVAMIVVQVFLAGSALVNLGGSGSFMAHIEFGYSAVGLAALALLLTAVAGGVGRRQIGITFGLLLLYVAQTALPSLRTVSPAIAALHPVNALLMFGLAAWYARVAWRARAPTSTRLPEASAAAAGPGMVSTPETS